MSTCKVSELNSTIVVNASAISTTLTPFTHTQGGGQMVNMPCLLTAMVDFTSETCLVVVSILPYDDVTSFRSEIDHGGQ